jgi:hypothetical protein
VGTVSEQTPRPPRRPTPKSGHFFESAAGGVDPAEVTEAADRAAHLLVRGARTSADRAVGDRLLHLAESEGIEAIAEVWSGSPADSLAGCLWRLYLLRSWVHADPYQVAQEFEAGRTGAQVARVVAGVADPPGPDALKAMVDEVLRGIAERDFADVLLRAAAFARVVATGRAVLEDRGSAGMRRMLLLSEQLEAGGHAELAHRLA